MCMLPLKIFLSFPFFFFFITQSSLFPIQWTPHLTSTWIQVSLCTRHMCWQSHRELHAQWRNRLRYFLLFLYFCKRWNFAHHIDWVISSHSHHQQSFLCFHVILSMATLTYNKNNNNNNIFISSVFIYSSLRWSTSWLIWILTGSIQWKAKLSRITMMYSHRLSLDPTRTHLFEVSVLGLVNREKSVIKWVLPLNKLTCSKLY